MTTYDYFSIAYGALATVSLSLVSIVLGVPLGLGLALIRWSRLPVLNQLTIGYVSIVRTCPSVTLVLLIFYALPVVGISMEPLSAAILTLTLSTAAFNTEIWRSALTNFPRDQYDAALTVGMRRGLALPAHRPAADHPLKPARSGQRDDAADQEYTGRCRHRHRRDNTRRHPRRRPHL